MKLSALIKSRFLEDGGGAGILSLVSSKHYEGEFTDGKIQEATVDPTIYIYDPYIWEVRPKHEFSDEKFRLFLGTVEKPPKILEKNEKADESLILEVPVNLKGKFEKNLAKAMLDYANTNTVSKNGYILNAPAIIKSFKHQSILTKQVHDFTDTIGVRTGDFRNLNDHKYQRWVHLDLAETGDSAGVSCGYIREFVSVMGEDGSFTDEKMPLIDVDFTLEIPPPPNGEIKFYKLRELLYHLTKLGLPIKWVTADTYQSTDFLQILRRKGYTTGKLSVDTTTFGYDLTKQAMYESRLYLPEHETCQTEFRQLERVKRNGSGKTKFKIDHPPNGSKDCSDSVAGVVQGLTTRRALWYRHGVSTTSIPLELQMAQRKSENKVKEE